MSSISARLLLEALSFTPRWGRDVNQSPRRWYRPGGGCVVLHLQPRDHRLRHRGVTHAGRVHRDCFIPRHRPQRRDPPRARRCAHAEPVVRRGPSAAAEICQFVAGEICPRRRRAGRHCFLHAARGHARSLAESTARTGNDARRCRPRCQPQRARRGRAVATPRDPRPLLLLNPVIRSGKCFIPVGCVTSC